MLTVRRTLDLRHCTLTCSVTCTLTCSVTCTLISAKNRRAAARDARGRGLPGRHSALPRVPEGGAHAETLPLHQVRHRQAAVTGRISYQNILRGVFTVYVYSELITDPSCMLDQRFEMQCLFYGIHQNPNAECVWL